MLRRSVVIYPCLIVTAFYLVALIIYDKLITLPEFNTYQKSLTYISKPFSREPKTILLWNSFFSSRTWYLPANTVNESYFVTENCPETNCVITNDRSFLKSESQFDAILFHTAEAFPLLKPFPTERRPEQIFVFASMESPAHTKHDFSDEFDFYNLTMTYRTDSDIFWPYGLLQDVETKQIMAPTSQKIWRKPIIEFELDLTVEKQLIMKTKIAVWFVSHCNSLSNRDELAKALQRHINIDIYGKCGTLRCPPESPECDDKLDQEYKFYLSFENSLCTDYVTEKFFNVLGRNIVPVVFGGADYTRFAPPHSYVNVNDFKSVIDLANYLKYLHENPTEYRKYFWWKKFYKPIFPRPFCELCIKLNNPSNREKVQYYKNIEEWWYGHSCHLTANISLS